MRILSINLCMDTALTALGHEVLGLTLPAGVHDLHAQARVSAFQPDVVIQQESLGNAVLLADVGTFSCPKAFWSLDTHLNLFWHRYYGRLFDCFLTPHADFCAEAPLHWQHPYTRRLPFVGQSMPWRAHASRRDALNFVGRITPQRPLRQRAIQFWQQRYVMGLHQDISRADMMTLYADTRILPNETIAFESNFRLLEGASCGCCLISPHIGADQDAVLEPGKEVLVYSDALECMELIDLCLRKPRMAEAVGRMAYERVQAQHLPEHRAVELLQALAEAPALALLGTKTHEMLWCSAAELELTGSFGNSEGQSLWDHDVYGTATTLALRLRFAQHRQDMPQCAALLHEALHILPQSPWPLAFGTGQQRAGDCESQHGKPHEAQHWNEHAFAGALMAEAAASMGLHCLKGGDLELAHHFWHRFQYCLGENPPSAFAGLKECSVSVVNPDRPSKPDTQAADLALLWAEKLYAAHAHWYAALEFLSFVPKHGVHDSAWAEQWMLLAPVVRHFPLLALSGLARLSLNSACDARLQAAYIATNIRCFRLQEAQEELATFTAQGASTQQEALFWDALRAQCKNIHRLGEALQPFS